MDTSRSDYAPILAEGRLERRTGLRAWRQRRETLPASAPGTTVVVIDGRGSVMSGESFTAGEQFWGTGTWQTVDIGDHELLCGFHVHSIDGRAGYDVEVHVLARIVSPLDVVRRRITTVAAHIKPALHGGVQNAMGRTMAGERDTVERLNADRATVEAVIRERLLTSQVTEVAGWLTYQVLDAAVTFDDATRAHLDRLVAQERAAEIEVIDLKNQKASTGVRIEIRQQWTEHLKEQLSGPLSRAVAAAVSDPTPQAIAHAVDQLNATDRANRSEVMSVLHRVLEGNFVGDLRELETVRVIVEGMQQRTAVGMELTEGPDEPRALAGVAVEEQHPAGGGTTAAQPADRVWED